MNIIRQTNDILDSLASNSFLSLVLQATRITSYPNTLLIHFQMLLSQTYRVIDPEIISGYWTATISDHLI